MNKSKIFVVEFKEGDGTRWNHSDEELRALIQRELEKRFVQKATAGPVPLVVIYPVISRENGRFSRPPCFDVV